MPQTSMSVMDGARAMMSRWCVGVAICSGGLWKAENKRMWWIQSRGPCVGNLLGLPVLSDGRLGSRRSLGQVA